MSYQISATIFDFELQKRAPNAYFDKYYITKDLEFIKKKYTPEYLSSIGFLDADMLTKFYSLYFLGELNILSKMDNALSKLDERNSIISFINLLFDVLWFVKDNSVRIDTIYFWDEKSRKLFKHHNHYHSFKSNGEREITVFKQSEIETMTKIFPIVLNMLNVGSDELTKITKLYPEIDYTLGNDRLKIAHQFIIFARNAYYIPQKISFYMSCLECLFSVTGQEITYRLSETVALYVGGDTDTKIKTFQGIKDAYEIRSKVVHGSQMPNKFKTKSKIIPISKFCDDLVRKVFLKILFEDADIFLDDKKRTDYLNILPFSTPDKIFFPERVYLG